MFIFILIDAQYSQKAVFSFEKGSNRENHSSSGSLHPVKKFTLVTFLIPPQPLIAIWKTPIYKFLWPLFVDGCNCLKAIKSHYEETVYFLPEVPLIKSISEGWKAEMTLQSSSGLELVYQPSYRQT